MSGLKYIGNFEKSKNSVLFIPGTSLSPEIFNHVDLPEDYQGVKVSWINSECNKELQNVAEEIIEFIKENELKNVILAGHSSGGVISMMAYLIGKDVVSGLLISNTGANTTSHTGTDLPERIKTGWGENDRIGFINRCFQKPLDDEMFKTLLDYSNSLTNEQFLRPVVNVRRIDLSNSLNKIECPVIIAHGKLDKVRKTENAEILHENIKNSELIFLDAGHSPMYEDSENYSKSLLKLIKKAKEK